MKGKYEPEEGEVEREKAVELRMFLGFCRVPGL